MKRLLEAVIRREAIFEEDMWNMMWRNVPGHGIPYRLAKPKTV